MSSHVTLAVLRRNIFCPSRLLLRLSMFDCSVLNDNHRITCQLLLSLFPQCGLKCNSYYRRLLKVNTPTALHYSFQHPNFASTPRIELFVTPLILVNAKCLGDAQSRRHP